MARIITLPDCFALYYNNRLVLMNKSFMYVSMMYEVIKDGCS